jgi:hypothetical protein
MTRLDDLRALRGRMARASRAMQILPSDDPAMTPEQQAILHLYDMLDALLDQAAEVGDAPAPVFRSCRRSAMGPVFLSRRIAA